ncbi:MAG: hypothetical protein M2R45_03125 [Verrucomicrobia subdivision 3 bacterium]|nr:hypothetical protein [Limisphaerales bacterium]MCS1413193.1 hypothetical protein [Limisphaerales bacterium]
MGVIGTRFRGEQRFCSLSEQEETESSEKKRNLRYLLFQSNSWLWSMLFCAEELITSLGQSSGFAIRH